jgi:hypothetical protein
MVGTASAGMGQLHPAAVLSANSARAAALSTFRRIALVDVAYFTTVRPYSQEFCEYLSANLHI